MPTNNTFAQTPGSLDLKFVAGDQISISLTFNQNLTNYTFESCIKTKNDTVPLEIVPIDLSLGKIQLVLNQTNASKIVFGTYAWCFKWSTNGVTRTILSGKVDAIR